MRACLQRQEEEMMFALLSSRRVPNRGSRQASWLLALGEQNQLQLRHSAGLAPASTFMP